MRSVLDQIIDAGWLAAKAGLLVVILCLLLSLILGPAAGTFVTAVAFNTNSFLQGLPAGTIVGLAAVVLAYELLKSSRNG